MLSRHLRKMTDKKAAGGNDNFSRRECDFAVQMKLRLELSRSIVQSIVDDWAIGRNDSTRKRTFYLIDCTLITFPASCHSRLKLLAARNALAHDATDGCNTLALLWKRATTPRKTRNFARRRRDWRDCVSVWLPVYFQQARSSKPRQSVVSKAFSRRQYSHSRVKILQF